MKTRPVCEAERLNVCSMYGSRDGAYHCQPVPAHTMETTETRTPGDDNTWDQVTSSPCSTSSCKSVESVKNKNDESERNSENPPKIQNGRGNPPRSKSQPPMVGPNMDPTPKNDSARDVALPWCSALTCLQARVKAAGVKPASPDNGEDQNQGRMNL